MEEGLLPCLHNIELAPSYCCVLLVPLQEMKTDHQEVTEYPSGKTAGPALCKGKSSPHLRYQHPLLALLGLQ